MLQKKAVPLPANLRFPIGITVGKLSQHVILLETDIASGIIVIGKPGGGRIRSMPHAQEAD